MDIHVVPAVIALVVAALAGFLYKRETAAITLIVVVIVTGIAAVDQYREKAINTPAPCVQDHGGCTSTGTAEYLVALIVMFGVACIVALLGAGLYYVTHRPKKIGTRRPPTGFDPIKWPERPGSTPRHRR